MDSVGQKVAELEATKPGNGAKTSDYYQTKDIPERFNNPVSSYSDPVPVISNPGNPVFSCPRNMNSAVGVSEHTSLTASEDVFKGYNTKTQHPMYMTSSMNYGSRSPTVHTMPTTFHAKCQKFSDKLGKCGMYRDHSLNTSMDKSFV